MTRAKKNPVDAMVGAKIKRHRQRLGVSQVQLAKMVGVTFQQVQKYERGDNRIGASRLLLIAEALSVSPGFFFEKEDAGGTTPGKSSNAVQGLELLKGFLAIPDVQLRTATMHFVNEVARFAASDPRKQQVAKAVGKAPDARSRAARDDA